MTATATPTQTGTPYMLVKANAKNREEGVVAVGTIFELQPIRVEMREKGIATAIYPNTKTIEFMLGW